MKSKKIISIIGAGSWGTALALLLRDQGHQVALWFYGETEYLAARETGENPFLPGFDLAGIELSDDLERLVQTAQYLILASPVQYTRAVLSQVAAPAATTRVINVSKGIEQQSFKLMHEIVDEVWPQVDKFACLSGPSFAQEVASGQSTIVSIGAEKIELAREIQRLFATDKFRPYASNDLIGVEVGGALKNIIAIASGMVVGLGGGMNTRAALIVRGLAEIRRLGVRLGGQSKTFQGPAGLGDLYLTASSEQSRNYSFGLSIGQGQSADDLLQAKKGVVEGYYTAEALYHKAKDLSVEMPIASEMYKILFTGKDPKQAIADLMSRYLREE